MTPHFSINIKILLPSIYNSQQIIVLCDNSSPTRGEGKFDWKREEVFTLLEYISDVFPKLNDRSTGKETIWKEVAEKFCNSRITALRCSQKWANLEKIYNNYIKSQKQTGEGRKKPPPYFDEVDSILRGKHKIFPPLVLDSETPIAITDNIPLPLREVENTLDLEELVTKNTTTNCTTKLINSFLKKNR